ncbi:MAG: SAM-dependent DNA methyltransferase, partial [Planctomycetota bacterium]
MAKRKASKNGNGANLGFEEKLWAAADKLRGDMDAAEYKHVVLGLVFLKYISDAFQELHDRLAEDEYSDPEDRDEYVAENVFWVPKDARWAKLQASAKQPTIGLGDAESRSKDVLGRVYEYFLGKFANAEGKGGGEFCTPQSVVKLLVEMIEPYKGRIYDPCCG